MPGSAILDISQSEYELMVIRLNVRCGASHGDHVTLENKYPSSVGKEKVEGAISHSQNVAEQLLVLKIHRLSRFAPNIKMKGRHGNPEMCSYSNCPVSNAHVIVTSSQVF